MNKLSTRLPVLTAIAILVIALAGCNDNKFDDSYFPLVKKDLKVIKSESQSFMVDTLLTGLSNPYSMAFLPDHTVLITQREGKIIMIREGKMLPEPVGGDVPKGLRDIVLDPEYKSNGWIYLSYYIEPVKPDGGYTVLMRAKLKGDKLTDSKVLYKAGPFPDRGGWYGSKIAFDRNGYLFFGVGQRGEDPDAQNISKYSGKIMRLNKDGSIPADNPFRDTTGALPEMYTYGHRQIQGLIAHPVTGELWEHEHGEKGGDELNIIKPGNYGWPLVTFSTYYDEDKAHPDKTISKDTAREGMVSPVHHWTPSIAPLAMAFITGNNYPGWKGDLFLGSGVQRMLNHSVMRNGRVVHDEKLLKDIGRVRDVKYGPDHFLYIMTEDTGLLLRLLPANNQ